MKQVLEYGVDVAATRADQIEKRLLSQVAQQTAMGNEPRVVDIGCGAGGAATRLVAAGAHVTAVDRCIPAAISSTAIISYIEQDVRDWLNATTEQYDYCLLNRVLHYLSYADAHTVVSSLAQRADYLYVGVSGLGSDLARGYPTAAHNVAHRHGPLAPAAQQTFSITAAVTLYRESELLALLTDAGWSARWSRTTDFGNAIAEATCV
jgi:SAM-dependent methyltransferase